MDLNSQQARRTRVLIAATAAYTVGWAAIWAQPVLLAEALHYRGASVDNIGLVFALEMIVLSTCSALFSRIGRGKPFLLIMGAGLVVAVAGNLWAFFADSFTPFLAARLLSGVGEGAALMSAFGALASDPKPDRAFALMTVLSGLIATAMMYSIPAVGQLTGGAAPTLSTLFIVYGLLAPALCLLPAAMVYAGSGEKPAGPSMRIDARAATLWVSMFMALIGNGAAWPFYYVIGLDVGLPPADVNSVISLSIVASIAGGLVAAFVGARFGRRAPIVFGLTATAISLCMITQAQHGLVYAVGVNLCMFASYFTLPFYAGYACALDESGKTTALLSSAGPIAFAAGAAIGGVLWTRADHVVLAWLAIGSCALAAALLLAVGVRPMKGARLAGELPS